jgi:hypothetical protein
VHETGREDSRGFLLQPVDWADLAYAVFVGAVFAVVKAVSITQPEWRLGISDSLVPSLLTVGYMVCRARYQPGKLDEWGITTRITAPAVLVSAILLCTGIAVLAAAGIALAGSLTFEPAYVSRMVEYILGAFPQQFFMCSVGLVTLSKLRSLQGLWRLPLAVGAVFALAHFWTPVRIPGSIVPVQIVITFPVGFAAAWYFLRFRSIVPLTVLHAILYILLNRWVEAHL